MGDQIVVTPASVQRVDLTTSGSPTINFDLPPAIKCVISEVATTVSVGRVPPGGGSGEVLTKTSAADYAMGWQVPTGTPGGSGGTSLLYDISFPADPETGSWFVFSADVASGLVWKDIDGTTDLTAAEAGDAARYDGTDWVKIGSFADQTIPDAYTLPDATESVKGGVQGATSAQASAASGTTILAWTQNRIRQVITAALPSGTSGEATGTTAVRRVWTPAKLREAANAAIRLLVPSVFLSGNTSIIPTDKLGSGVRSGSTYLKGDGSFGEGPTPAEGGPLNSVALTKVGSTVSISGSTTTGPAFENLSDVIWLSFEYDRVNAGIEFNTLVLKSEIEGVTVGNAKKLQLQGGGGGYGNLYDVGGNLTFGVFDAQYANVTCKVYKLTGAGDGLSQTDGDARYLQLSGGTLTGFITLSGAPTADLHPATKKYVDDLVAAAGGGGSNVPDKPATAASAKRYDLRISSGGAASWIEVGAGSWDKVADVPSATETLPFGIDFNSSDVLYLTGSGRDRVHSWDGSSWTRVTNAPSGENNPRDVAFDSSDVLYLVGNGSDDVWSYDGSTWTKFADAPAGETVPRGLAFNSSDVLHVVGTALDAVWSYDGSAWSKVADVPAGENTAATIAFDGDDVLHLIGQTLNAVYKYESSTWSKVIDAPSGETSSTGIAFDSEGALYLVGQTLDDVFKFNVPAGGGTGERGPAGPAGESYDDTALRADVDAIEANLDALDAPLSLGAFVNATADDLAAGFGCFISDNTGRYSDSDFVVTGNVPTPTTAARMYVRVPKHRSRHGIKIRVGNRAYPDDDPATGEYLVPVERDVIGQMQNPPLFSGAASVLADYFYIAFVSNDEAAQYLNFSGAYQLEIAPIIYPDYLTIYYWQDGTAAPRTAAGHAVATAGRTGELIPVIFAEKDRPRNLHFLVPNKWEVTDIIIGGESAIGDFTSRAFNTVSTIYDSARIRSQGEVTCLVWLEEA